MRNIGWHELRSARETSGALNISVATFLDSVRETAEDAALGEGLMLLVPFNRIGEAVSMTTMGFPQDGLSCHLIREPGIESGLGCSYAGTLAAIQIYTWPFNDAAILCSRTLIRSVRDGRVRDRDEIFDFEFFI